MLKASVEGSWPGWLNIALRCLWIRVRSPVGTEETLKVFPIRLYTCWLVEVPVATSCACSKASCARLKSHTHRTESKSSTWSVVRSNTDPQNADSIPKDAKLAKETPVTYAYTPIWHTNRGPTCNISRRRPPSNSREKSALSCVTLRDLPKSGAILSQVASVSQVVD